MAINIPAIREMDSADQLATTGGDDFESSWGLILGFAFAGGLIVTSPISGAVVTGAVLGGLVFAAASEFL